MAVVEEVLQVAEQVQMAVLVVVVEEVITLTQTVELEIRQAHLRHKEVMVEQDKFGVVVLGILVVVVEQEQQVVHLQVAQVVMAVLVQHLVYLVLL
jgi:hypothetical protein